VQRFQENTNSDLIKRWSSSTYGPQEIVISFLGKLHFFKPCPLIWSISSPGYFYRCFSTLL